MPPVIAIGALTRAQLLAEIYRLYRQLRALPGAWQTPASPDRRALEAEIFAYAQAYKATDAHAHDDRQTRAVRA